MTEKCKHFYTFSRLGRYFFVQTCSGAVYEIEKDAFQFFNNGNNKSYEIADELSLELSELDCRNVSYYNRAKKLEERNYSPKALCLNITRECNLRCDYCFADRDRKKSKIMDIDTAKASVDFLFKGVLSNYEIDFFGGEPLLGWDTIVYTINYAQELAEKLDKKIKFALTTNALLLDDEKSTFLKQNNVQLTLSLDGDAPINNQYRKTKSGTACFDIVFENIMNALLMRDFKDYYLRGTYTGKTPYFFDAASFFMENDIYNFSLEPVVSTDSSFAIDKKIIPIIEREYDKVSRLILMEEEKGKDVSFYHFCLHIYNTPCLEKRLKSCGAGVEYFAVSPEGKLYPCHQFMDIKDFVLGDVFKGLNNKSNNLDFSRLHLFNKDNCPDCWARIFCSGGCHANHYLHSGSLFKVEGISCEIQKIHLEYAIAIEAIRKTRKEQIERLVL